ncbi:MAG: hypothetical protein ACRBN8_46160 [Nannocystales bacterium]
MTSQVRSELGLALLAVTAPQPVIFLTMLALKATEYAMVFVSFLALTAVGSGFYAVARFMRQLP